MGQIQGLTGVTMSVYLYDEAIVNRIKSVLGNQEINIITAEKAFSKSMESQDSPQLPAISLYRDKFTLTKEVRNMPSYRTGRTEASEDNLVYRTQSLPITINYQIDVWTRKREQNDEFVRDLIWFFTLFPEHKLTLRYAGFVRAVKFNTFLEEDIVNNSQINDFEDKGQVYRSTLGLYVDEAQLFMVTPVNQVVFDFEILSLESTAGPNEGE